MNDTTFRRVFPFPSAREGQREIVERILEQYELGMDNVVLCAPTAVGKSAIAVAVARAIGYSYLLTSQKQLQEQYMGDFRHLGMNLVKGKYNYTCNENPKLKCDMGECIKHKNQRKCNNCPYVVARDLAYSSPIAVFNYAYFLNMTRSDYERHIPRDFLILDEAHNVEEELISFMTVKLDVEDFKKFEVVGVVQIPDEELTDKDKFKWLFGTAKSQLVKRHAEELIYFEDMDKNHSQYYNQSRKVSYLDTLVCMINRLAEVKGTPGVVTQNMTHDITFKPLKANKYGDMLTEFGGKVLAMSATVFDKDQFCEDIGMDPETTAFISCDSPIPAERRPVFNVGGVDLSYKNKQSNLPILKNAVQEVLDMHEGERGIIHTVSYDVAKYLIENINTDRFVMPRGKTRDAEIAKFKHSKRNDLVLISPSLTEGISLDDDLSRFTIVCKLPYGNLGDPWIKRRMKASQNWYNTMTIQTLVQMTGRSVRSKDDSAVAYILDKSFDWFYGRNKSKFPDWWKVSLVK
jgi:Rad3-related DNA helicase